MGDCFTCGACHQPVPCNYTMWHFMTKHNLPIIYPGTPCVCGRTFETWDEVMRHLQKQGRECMITYELGTGYNTGGDV